MLVASTYGVMIGAISPLSISDPKKCAAPAAVASNSLKDLLKMTMAPTQACVWIPAAPLAIRLVLNVLNFMGMNIDARSPHLSRPISQP